MSFKWNDVKNKSSKELYEILNDEIINKGGNVSIEFLSSEMRRKEQKEQNKIMIICTVAITLMTLVILFATLISANIISCG
ncbi:MAG: hypothetical protein JXN65_07185 [Clostridia bacterium]|nr:hypothetical protein [Clostridia bacterium]